MRCWICVSTQPHARHAGDAQRRHRSSTCAQHDALARPQRLAVVGARDSTTSRDARWKRLDLTSRTLVALIEPGSCFAGFLAEVLFAADRSYMLDGALGDNAAPAELSLLARAQLRRLPDVQWTQPARDAFLRRSVGGASAFARSLAIASMRGRAQPPGSSRSRRRNRLARRDPARCWKSARASRPTRSPRSKRTCAFAGPETLETKIFARLSAWQNWIFQRPNAVGDERRAPLYGTGQRPRFDKTRM